MRYPHFVAMLAVASLAVVVVAPTSALVTPPGNQEIDVQFGTGRVSQPGTALSPDITTETEGLLPGVIPIGPFMGDLFESWERFLNYLDNPLFHEHSPAVIFSGHAIIENGLMAIYEPGVAEFGIAGGLAQVVDGFKGMGLDDPQQVARITFATPVNSFGGWWGSGGEVNVIEFYDVTGGLIDVFQFPYPGDINGALQWHGWFSDTPIRTILYSGDFVVNDFLQINLVDPCADCPCPEDTNRDGVVDFADILSILSGWGDCPNPDGCDTPGECGNYTRCGFGDPFDCLCWTTYEGDGVCYQDFFCDQPQCPDGRCPPGHVCVVDSCCEANICAPRITCDDFAAPVPPGKSGLTASGAYVSAESVNLDQSVELSHDGLIPPFEDTTRLTAANAGTCGSSTHAPADRQATLFGIEPIAQRTIFLSRGEGPFTPMNVAYHPGFGQYYASDGGNTAADAWVYDIVGNRIQDFAPINIDVRAWNFMPDAGRLEVITFDALNGDGGIERGLIEPGVDGIGFLTGATTNLLAALPGLNGSQTMPAYDPLEDVFLSRDQNARVHIVNRGSGALLGSVVLDLAAAGVGPNDVTFFALGFDSGLRCFIVTEKQLNRALVFGPGGEYLGASRLDIPVPNAYAMGYTNGQLFVFDFERNGWQGYRIKRADPCDDCPCPGDVNRDHVVDFADILRILSAWGPCPELFCDNCDDGFVERCLENELCHDCETPEGQCPCVQQTSCGDLERCFDGICPPGFFCCTNTCCGEPVCMQPCELATDAPGFKPGDFTSGGVMD